MTNPNFQQMSRKELKAYIRQHPTDDDAIRELVLNRKNPNSQLYPPPQEMDYYEVEAIFKAKLNQEENS